MDKDPAVIPATQMPSFKIAVVEDSDGTRGILGERLTEQLEEASPGSLPAWPNAGTISFEMAPLPRESVERLAEVTTVEEATSILEDLFEDGKPNLLILDLALSDPQAATLDGAGGGDEFGLEDPSAALEGTSGFVILKAWSRQCPVLVTTYASNPIIITRCLDAGAHDVVIKPLDDKDMSSVHHRLAEQGAKVAGTSPTQLEEVLKHKPKVDTYVRCVAHEILKAVRMAALQGLEEAAPAHVPFWLATDLTRIDPNALDGTNLMLIDIRGFSEMVHKGKDVPSAVFELMNAIWTEVFDVLNNHGAEVNNIIGDAALAFRGVYGDEEEPVALADTLACAKEINELFVPDGALRRTLTEIIEENYDALSDTETNARENMLGLVKGEHFGVRVISIEPDRREALYGKVGGSRRWQHTILSRFMNFLARGEAEISKWERAQAFERQPGESFLLWRREKDLPEIEGFAFEDPNAFLGQERDDIRDIPEHVEIFRVLPAVAPVEA